MQRLARHKVWSQQFTRLLILGPEVLPSESQQQILVIVRNPDKDVMLSADGLGTAPSGQSLPVPTTNGTGHSPQPPCSTPADGAPASDAPTAAATTAASGLDGEQRKDAARTPAEEDALLARAQTIRVRSDGSGLNLSLCRMLWSVSCVWGCADWGAFDEHLWLSSCACLA